MREERHRPSIEAVDIRNYELYGHTQCIGWGLCGHIPMGPFSEFSVVQEMYEEIVRGKVGGPA